MPDALNVTVGKAREGHRIIRVEINRAREIIDTAADALSGSLVPVIAAFQIGLIGFDIVRVAPGRLGLAANPQTQPRGDAAGDLVLDREDVLKRAVVAVAGPDDAAVF